MIDKIIVNGKEEMISLDGSEDFSSLIQMIYEKYSTKTHALSSLKVNGIEISPDTEALLGGESVRNVKSVDVEVIPTDDVAHKTLMNVRDSLKSMIELSHKLSVEQDTKIFDFGFIELVEGLQTTFEAVELVKKYWDLSSDEDVMLLEENLESAISKVLLFRQSKQDSKVKSVLRKELPESLQYWWDVAIPSMMHNRFKNSKDS